MIYKNKKYNKFAIICVVFLIALSSMLAINPTWLSGVYDTTLCASATAPTIDSTYFDYRSNLISTYDWTFSNRFNYGNTTIKAKVVDLSSSFLVFSNTTLTGKYYGASSPDNIYAFADNFNYDYYDFSVTIKSQAAGTLGVDMFVFSSLTNATLSILTNYDWVGYVNISDTYYIICSDSLYSKYLAYRTGLADGDNYDTAYQDGYTAGYNAGLSDGIIQGQNNVINNPSEYGLYTQSEYEQNYTNGYNDGINNVVSNPSAYNLYTQTEYDNNYSAGQESSTNYQDGYNDGLTQGQNNVINNPSEYGLYTQSEYEQNYTNGYNYASNLYKYGFTFNSQLYVKLTDQSDYVPIDYAYVDNGIKLADTSIDYIKNNFIVSNEFIQFKLVTTNELSIMYPTFNFFENGVTQNTINTFIGTAQNIDDSVTSLVSMQYTYNSIDNGGIVTGDNVANFNPASYRGGSWTGTISQQAMNTDLYNVTLYNYDSTHKYYNYNTLVFGFAYNEDDLSRIFISDYNQSYINGYEDGRTMINSGAYDEGYTAGYDTAYNLSYDIAYNDGKSDGIASANNYSFNSLISSVVDAPLNMIKQTFNFEFLGINLFSFITSLFTLALVIFIITKFMKR